MIVETDSGTYNVEFSLESMKRMELTGLRPLKIMDQAGEDPMNIMVTDMTAMLDVCATPQGNNMPMFSVSLEASGFGLGDIMEIFAEVFTKSPFLTNRRLRR